MSQIMVYILPLILGRTFNMGKDSVGVDIFPKEMVDNPTVISKPFVSTRHKFVESTKEARDFLEAGGSFSLKVKGGLLKAGASGSYLGDTESRENGIEMLITARFETVTETLPDEAKPKPDWLVEDPELLGTHYVRSVIYGGELITSVLMKSNTTREMKHIKGAVEVGGRAAGFLDVDVEVEGEYLNQLANSLDSVEIKYYSSVPISFVPGSMKDLHRLIDLFYDEVRKYNNGKGVPIRVELWPLTSLEPSRPTFSANNILEEHLEKLEDHLDDLLTTRAVLRKWLKDINQRLTDAQENKVGQFSDKLERVIQAFYKVIGDLDIRNDEKQLQTAIEAYANDVDVPIRGAYYRSYLKLREEVTNDMPTDFWRPVKGNGAVYTHWGGQACVGAWPDTILTGYLSSGTSTDGGVASYLCLSENSTLGINGSDLHTPKVYMTNFDILVSQPDSTTMVNVKYLASCAVCGLPSAGSVRTFPGTNHCPIHWSELYQGYLVGSSKGGELICLDRNPDANDILQDARVGWLKNVVMKESSVIPCVVCSN